MWARGYHHGDFSHIFNASERVYQSILFLGFQCNLSLQSLRCAIHGIYRWFLIRVAEFQYHASWKMSHGSHICKGCATEPLGFYTLVISVNLATMGTPWWTGQPWLELCSLSSICLQSLKPKCPVREFQITQSKDPNVPSLGGKKRLWPECKVW
jgi:hypothetical protein